MSKLWRVERLGVSMYYLIDLDADFPKVALPKLVLVCFLDFLELENLGVDHWMDVRVFNGAVHLFKLQSTSNN